MAAQWPLVVAKLVAYLPTLPGWSVVSVFDGPPVTDDSPPNYCTVGYVLSTNSTDDHSGSYSTTQDPSGFRIQETGEIMSQLTVQTGDVDLPGMRGLAFSLTDALDASIRVDRTLGGVLAPESTVDLAVQPLSVQNRDGTAFSVVFNVRYFTIT
jgi:hypothetical protein